MLPLQRKLLLKKLPQRKQLNNQHNNPRFIGRSVRGGFFVVIFFCFAKSDMIADGNRDIETCGFSDILFADKLPQAIKLVKRQNKLRSNITCMPRE